MLIKTKKGNWEKLEMKTPGGGKVTVYSHGFYPLWVYTKWNSESLRFEISTFGIWKDKKGEVVPFKLGFVDEAFLDEVQEKYEEG